MEYRPKTLHNTFKDVYGGDLSWTRNIPFPAKRSKIIVVNKFMNAMCKDVVEFIWIDKQFMNREQEFEDYWPVHFIDPVNKAHTGILCQWDRQATTFHLPATVLLTSKDYKTFIKRFLHMYFI